MIEIIHGNCTDLPPDECAAFGAMITDPPYSDHVHDKATTCGVGQGGRGARDRDLGFVALRRPLRTWIARAAARVQGWSLIYSDIESASVWRIACLAAKAEYIRTVPAVLESDDDDEADAWHLPWTRWSQPQRTGDRPCTGAEMVTVVWGPAGTRKRWTGPGGLMAFTRQAMRGQDKHPTEKPIDLLLDQVSWFSEPGATVFDPCVGSGTAAQACRLLGRDFVGFELDESWARRANARVRSPLSDRDRVRAETWALETLAEASAALARPPAADGSDANTRRRAEARGADAERVAGAL